MLRESALNTKRAELQKCVTSRKRKLSELYSVAATVNATVTISTSTHDGDTLPKFTKVEFQNENDITRGRVFDVATIARIPGFWTKYSQPVPGIWQENGYNKSPISNAATSKASQADVPSAQDASLASDTSHKRLLETGDLQAPPLAVPKETDGVGKGSDQSLWGHKPMQEENVLETNHGADIGSQAIKARSTSPRTHGRETLPIGAKSQQTPDNVGKQPSSEALNKIESDSDHASHPALGTPKTNTSPLTPGAQLQQEAARFTDRQVQTEHAVSAPGAKAREDSVKVGVLGDGPAPRPSKPSEEATIAARRQAGTQDQRLLGMTSDTSRDIMLSQRPPMRIDTTVSRPPQPTEASTPASTYTPLKTNMHSSPPERMTTRVSSGALRHKSVSEILNGPLKSATHPGDKTPENNREDTQYMSRRGSLVASPESASFKSRFDRDKDRSKLSQVVFARQQASDNARNGETAVGQQSRHAKSDEEKDYLIPLFAAQAEAQKPTLDELMKNSHKTLSTSNWYIHYHETQDCRILKRIYQLQNSNRWSFRQIERSAEPARPTSHWDVLLNEVKWMRTDFKEERKWKLAAARNLAEACAEWVNAANDLRPTLQVSIRKPTRKSTRHDHCTTPVSTPNAMDAKSDGTPELVPSAEDDLSDAPEELPLMDISKANAPAALFSLAPEDVLFSLDKTPAAEKLLSELPLYQPFVDSRGTKRSCAEMLDSAWRKPLVPVSKFTMGKLLTTSDGPPLKRSRYDYIEEDETEYDSTGRALLPLDRNEDSLPPEKDDVALFNPKNKHIIARLHAAHAFRPPSEFPMPSQPFFESRNPSQWTLAEDDELRRLVREYEYNWSMISACLSTPSLFSSGAERRTPWECFERWESFEGLPGDMEKHSYFRAWKSRRLNAKQHMEQLFVAQQQAGNTVQLRRRTAEPVHVERRRNNKHFALIHAMSKVAKKKETALQKQQHAASMAAMRKASEPTQRKLMMQTPKQFSDHKHKQEVDFKEKQQLYRQQLQNTRANSMASQRIAQQPGQQQGGLAVPQPGRMPISGQINGTSPRLASSLPHNATQAGGRPLPPSQAMLNGMVPNIANQNGQMQMRTGVGIPHPQMQSYMQGQQRLPAQNGQDSARVMVEAQKLQEQQRMMQQQRQFQNQANGVNGAMSSHNGNTIMSMQANSAMLGNLQANGKVTSSNSPHGHGHSRSSSSPSMIPAVQAQQLSNGMTPLLNQFANQLKAQYPNYTTDQIKSLATANLNQHLLNQNNQASSMLANNNPGHIQQQQGMSFKSSMNPQVYAQFMRSQQASQQNRNGGDAGGGRPESRGATPNGAGANGNSQSPHQSHAQVASTS